MNGSTLVVSHQTKDVFSFLLMSRKENTIKVGPWSEADGCVRGVLIR